MKRIRIVGWLFILGSVIAFSAYSYWVETRDLRPLAVAMPLTQGHKVYTFKTNVDYGYVINLKFMKRASFEQTACALGVNLDDYRLPPRCDGQKAVLDLGWVLTTDRKPVAKFSSTNDYLGDKEDADTFLRSLGRFNAKGGHVYALDIYVRHDERSLSPQNPVLSIEVGTLYGEKLGISYLICAFACLLGLIFGVVLLFLSRGPKWAPV